MRINLKSEAIIGTILVHIVLILIMNIFAISSKVEKVEEGVSFEIDFKQIQQAEEEIKELQKGNNTEASSNQAKNTASDFEERKPDYKSFEERASQELNQELNEIVKSVRGETGSDDAESIEQPKESLDSDTKEKTQPSKNEQKPSEYKGKTNINYSLENRFDTKLKVPVYMCEGTGSVVVEIEVDKYGFVKNTKVDKRTSSNNFCLQKAAEMAANKSRFNSSEKNPETQKGTITYSFVAQ